jgi:hypothetical protein
MTTSLAQPVRVAEPDQQSPRPIEVTALAVHQAERPTASYWVRRRRAAGH